MPFRRAAGVVISCLIAFLLPAPVSAASFEFRLVAVSDSPVGLGQPFRLKLVVSNTGSDSAIAGTRAHILETSTGQRVTFLRWSDFVPAGGTITYKTSVITGQWFDSSGSFKLSLTPDEATTTSPQLSFNVTKAPVRVPRFTDITQQAGLATNVSLYTCGDWSAGAAWGDVDGDKDLDLFLPRRDDPAKLWINSSGTFSDEASARGLATMAGRALGAVFADYDNDGDVDLYVASRGQDQLFRNNGSGSFEDVTLAVGVGDEGPSQSASWGDYDNDGFLDLYVANHASCEQDSSTRTWSNQPDHLYHNEGDGTFTDQTVLLHTQGSTLGAGFQAAWLDYDGDGDVDLYLANDFLGSTPQPNFLWRNDGPGAEGWTFTNVSVDSGTGASANAMGIAVGDYDRDIDLDIAVSNIRDPLLFRNEGDGTFTERAQAAGIARAYQDAQREAVTWGTFFADLNNDGWEDLFFAAGRLHRIDNEFQPDALFTNARNGTFLDHSAPSGVDNPGLGRGIAVADYNRDGRLDLYVAAQDGQPTLLRNSTAGAAHWLEVDTIGTISNRDGCGARLVLQLNRRSRLLRQVFCGGTSLGVGSDPTVHFGLGKVDEPLKLVIEWPSGIRQVMRNPRADRLIEVKEPSAS
ncbi:MAG: CRTAC1 family protein [Actinomycetota bacterium]